MISPSSTQKFSSPLIRWFIVFLILLGIALRIILWFQNRDLIIDEANIVRNLDERGFIDLALPLKYEQYCPPVFLWFEKLSAILFGYGEKAMRLYPLLCGIGALFVFYKVGKKIVPLTGLWLSVGIFATGNIFVSYAATMKQYMPDVFIALLLIWIALSVDIFQEKKRRFILIWLLAGTIAIWSSMPSVFVLAGIGCYYLWELKKAREWNMFLSLFIVGVLWAVQFTIYYFAILRSQIYSQYLIDFHHEYFLIPFPSNAKEWARDYERFYNIIGTTVGWKAINMVSGLLLLIIGIIALARQHSSKLVLIGMPVAFALLAAALKQFSLIERVSLFMYPLLLLLIGYGFYQITKFRFWPVTILFAAAGLFTIYDYGLLSILKHRLTFQELTEGLTYMESRHVPGRKLYVHQASIPTYLYYTNLHPKQAQWAGLRGAHLLNWDDNYTEVTSHITDTAWFVYSGGFPEQEKMRRTTEIAQNMKQIEFFVSCDAYVYGYIPKPKDMNQASDSSAVQK